MKAKNVDSLEAKPYALRFQSKGKIPTTTITTTTTKEEEGKKNEK